MAASQRDYLLLLAAVGIVCVGVGVLLWYVCWGSPED